VKTQSKELEKTGEYRQMLVQAIHACAIKFPDVAGSVVHLLMDFLGDQNVASALDVVFFVRESRSSTDHTFSWHVASTSFVPTPSSCSAQISLSHLSILRQLRATRSQVYQVA